MTKCRNSTNLYTVCTYVRTYVHTTHSIHNYATPQLWLHICRISSAHCEQLRDSHACIHTYVPQPISSSIALSFLRLSCSATSSSHSPTAAWWCLLPLATCWPPSLVQCSTWELDTENTALSATSAVSVKWGHSNMPNTPGALKEQICSCLQHTKAKVKLFLNTFIRTYERHWPSLAQTPHNQFAIGSATHTQYMHTYLLEAGEL